MFYKKTLFLIVLCLLFSIRDAFSQYQKEVIYFDFTHITKECEDDNLNMKWFKKEGLQFNLCGYAILLNEDFQNNDTLPIKELKHFSFTSPEQVERKVEVFREKTRNKLPQKDTDKLYQAYDRNDLFKTYLIEIINDDRFVIYPVRWRKQGIIP